MKDTGQNPAVDALQRERVARRQEAELLRSVLASSADCIKLLDLSGTVQFMSEGGQRTMEVADPATVLGCRWESFWEPPRDAAVREAVAAACAGRVGHFQGPARTMAGTPKYWDVQVTPLYGADGRPDRLLAVSRDITASHAAEQALREREAHWRSLFEKLQEGLILGEVVRDAEGVVTDWRYVEVNPAWGEQTGIAPASAIGRTVREMFPGIESAWIDEMAGVVATGQPVNFERQVGRIGRWYEGHAFALGGDRFAAMFVEVTQRKRAEDRRLALLELDDRFRDMEDLTAMAYVAAEVMGRTLAVDRVGYGTFGAGTETLLVERDWTRPGTPSVAGLHPMRRYGNFIEDLGRGVSVVVADITADARTADAAAALLGVGVRALVNLPLIEQGRLVAMLFVNHAEPRPWSAEELGFMRTVAERTRSAIERRRAEIGLRRLAASLEQQVAERTAEHDRVWTNSRDLLVVIGEDARLRAVNPAWTRILGHEVGEVVGRTLGEFAWPEPGEAAPPPAPAARQGDLPGREARFRHKDGSSRWICWHSSAEAGLVYAYGRDITAERDAQATLRDTEAALRQSQKMEAVGQLTGGLAHDFNNLLAGIIGSLELLSNRVARGRLADLDRYVGAAQGAARRAAALTHRLLAFSRRQTLDPSPTDIDRLVAGMEEMITRAVGPAIAVEAARTEAIWLARVDPNQLENALLNLCLNARDAMPDGGRIVIATANERLDRAAACERDLPEGDYVSLSVTDTGTGMTPEVVARAFDPFFTTKPIGQGTGLGLSMIYGFVRQSGGQVRVVSEPGHGTTMRLSLPRHHGAEDRAAPQHDLSDAPRAGQGETVLVVDDEPTVRMLVTEVLEELGYTAIEAGDGASGLRVLQSDVGIDLLVSDVGLPGGMNGRQLADAARQLRPGLKVLFITGYAENAGVEDGQLEPGMHVLTKPFPLEVLASRIRELIVAGG